jgi:hypothetical protein
MRGRIKFKSISHSVSSINEDFIGINNNEGWVLDGATSISGRRKEINGRIETDASWFVRRFSDEMKIQPTNVKMETRAKHILDSLLIEAHTEWGNWYAGDVPSSSFSHISVKNGEVEFINLGDCRLLYQADCEPINTFGSCRVASLDLDLLNEYKSIRKYPKKISHSAAWNTLVPTIRKNRISMNTPEGYWILSPDGGGLKHIEHVSIPYQKTLRALLVTDGLYRLVDTYFQINTTAFFEQAFESDGLKILIKQLRKIEASDPDSIVYPRVKLQDDATALSVHVMT